jgi:hypothetical protein
MLGATIVGIAARGRSIALLVAGNVVDGREAAIESCFQHAVTVHSPHRVERAQQTTRYVTETTRGGCEKQQTLRYKLLVAIRMQINRIPHEGA